MNARMVAAALRALADAIEDDGSDRQAPPVVQTASARRRRTPAPAGPVDELARAAARRALREKGYRAT